ncbi:hypothetical protein [Yokenella regensburgei]|uniref:hypothetical protein n=1 Tax=Yokenella regensburgei TaxID=158877 RepID=UPI001432DEBE|nr:hypothetical protein [Yokenella regensburgei]QIU92596.1 hypothetical protein HEC60_25195 [Yokenella regensburgei]
MNDLEVFSDKEKIDVVAQLQMAEKLHQHGVSLYMIAIATGLTMSELEKMFSNSLGKNIKPIKF